MVILRATQKVLRSLPISADDNDTSDTALGDWYVNRLMSGHQPFLLLISSKSLLPILTPARDLRSLPERLPEIVMRRLRQIPVELSLLGAEMDAMFTVRVGPTRDRSVVGTMVDFAKALPYYFDDTPTLQFAEERLAETPCRAGSRDVIFPVEATLRLLQHKWAVSGTRH